MTALLLALIYLTTADTLTGKVVRIADGDTVTILVGGNQVRVRLFGIDAPESRHSTAPTHPHHDSDRETDTS
jgi:micrococcal nuclease